jgi:uncharacterized membrane protein YgdD (TMEM256/DUF423 family)
MLYELLRRQRAPCRVAVALAMGLRIGKFSMSRNFVLVGAVFAALSVAAGAFGAHSLKAIIPAEMLTVFETAARYQMYHALALLIIGGMASHVSERDIRIAGWCFVGGIVLFSGSLYVVALTGTRWVGAITPLGGAAFLSGWIALAWNLWQKKE